jgi:hypothetical protein
MDISIDIVMGTCNQGNQGNDKSNGDRHNSDIRGHHCNIVI